MKYINTEKLIAEIERLKDIYPSWQVKSAMDDLRIFITSLWQEHEIVELSFKGGTYRVNGEEHPFKGGKAKVIILEINQEEE